MEEAKPDASSVLPADSSEANKEDLSRAEASSLDATEKPPAIAMAAEAPSEAVKAPSEAAEAPAAAGDPAAVAAPARVSRFAQLAAAVALAAALGAVAGSLSAAGVAHLWPAAAAAPKPAMAEANGLQAMKAELAELSALKASLEGAARNANSQFAKIADRLDHVERAQIEPAVKLAHMADAIDRLEKKSLTVAAAAPAAPAAPAGPETTGALGNKQPAAPGEAKLSDKIVQGWVVQDVRRGHALIESRYGGVFDVVPGNVVPGLGLVDSIKRQDGQWVVVTARGVITEH
jgi:hypothetical protein